MSDPDRPRSPFAGLADFSARPPVRLLSADEIEQMLAAHRLYLETEWRQGHRANFTSADLSGQDFSGLNLRGIKMDRAVLRGADFTGAHRRRRAGVGVDPLSWSPSGFQRRLFRCPRRVRPIHLSFVARWSIWFALDVIRSSLPASSSRQRSLSATGLRKPTGKRAAGRRRVAG